MEYKVNEITPQGLPYTKDGVYGVLLIIKIGIVGQTYNGFENFDCGDDTFCPILRTDGTELAEMKFGIFANAYVATKYPTT